MVYKSANALEALSFFDNAPIPDLVLLDINMPDMNGLSLLKILQEKFQNLPVIMLSGAGEMEYVIQALRLGAWNYIRKPLLEMGLLEHSIQHALEKKALQERLIHYQQGLEELVAQQYTKLVSNEERLSLALEATHDGIWDFNFPKASFYFSPRCFQLLGYKNNEVNLNPEFCRTLVHPDDLSSVNDFFTSFQKTNLYKNHIQHVLRFQHKNQSWKWFLIRGKIISRDENQQIIRITGAFTDITEQKNAESQLIQYTNDIEQYIYIYSHDLKEPLRMLNIFLQLLQKSDQYVLDEEHQYYLDYALKSSERMQNLISSMLDYTKISGTAVTKSSISLEKVVLEVLSALSLYIKETNAVISTGPLPLVNADAEMLYHVFYNLILNGLKFQKENKPQITICALDEKTYWKISVKDNGIGLKSEYAAKIFTLFQRLHHKDEYEGTGMGLAISKRIINQHGGQIWVVSAPGEGAEFFFTLPK